MQDYIDAGDGWNEREQHVLHHTRFANNDYRIIVHDGSDVGIAALELTPTSLKLNQIFLLEEFQDMGIGEMCMKVIEEEARTLGLPVELKVRKMNTSASDFYERLGFSKIGETEHHFLYSKRTDAQQPKR